MKKLGLFIAAFVMIIQMHAQSHSRGTWSFQLGYNAGLQTVVSDIKTNNMPVNQLKNTDFTSMLAFSAHNNLLKFFSLGVGGEYGQFFMDTATALPNKMRALNLESRIYLLNKDHYNVYLGAGFGFSSLKIQDILTNGSTEIMNFSTPNMQLLVGFNRYFFDVVGFHGHMIYSKKDFELKKVTLDQVEQDLTNIMHDKAMTGLSVQLGLSLNF